MTHRGLVPNLCCPICGGRLRTKDSRPMLYHGYSAVRRRRRCIKCDWAMSTYEVPADQLIELEARLSIIERARELYEQLGAVLAEHDSLGIPGSLTPASEPGDARLGPAPVGE